MTKERFFKADRAETWALIRFISRFRANEVQVEYHMDIRWLQIHHQILRSFKSRYRCIETFAMAQFLHLIRRARLLALGRFGCCHLTR